MISQHLTTHAASHTYPNDILELEDGLGLADLPGLADEHTGLEEEEVALLVDAVTLCLREPVLRERERPEPRSFHIAACVNGREFWHCGGFAIHVCSHFLL